MKTEQEIRKDIKFYKEEKDKKGKNKPNTKKIKDLVELIKIVQNLSVEKVEHERIKLIEELNKKDSLFEEYLANFTDFRRISDPQQRKDVRKVFDKDFNNHSKEIYTTPRWPSDPLFYASFSSKTDPETAPKNHENMVLLIPIAPGLEDNKLIRNKYFELIISRFEKITRQSIKNNIIYKRSYAIRDFKKDYNSFKGNAYGLANTLFQTAIFKPSIRNKKLKNLFFCGQLTVPGPGVPPAIISGGVVAKEVKK